MIRIVLLLLALPASAATLRGIVTLNHGKTADAVDRLQFARPYELGGTTQAAATGGTRSTPPSCEVKRTCELARV